MFLIIEVDEVCCQFGSPNPVAWLASDVQDSRARLRFWTKAFFRRRTMNAIIGVMRILSPLGRISTPRGKERHQSAAGAYGSRAA